MWIGDSVRWLPSTEENSHFPPSNNPHVHIIVSTRTVGLDGFTPKRIGNTTSVPTLRFGAELGLRFRTGPVRGAISKSGLATKAYGYRGLLENLSAM